MHRDDNKLEAMLERVYEMQASQQSGWMTIPEAAEMHRKLCSFQRSRAQIHLESEGLRRPYMRMRA